MAIWSRRPGKKIVDRIEFFKANNNRNYPIGSGDLESPFEIAVEFIGVENFLTGFYDNPCQMHELLKRSFDLWYEYVSKLHDLITTHQGGYFSLWNTWQPKNTVWISIDAAMNVSPRIFERFFIPVIGRILKNFDWIWIHLHSAATAHVINFLKDESRIKGFEIANDPNCPAHNIFGLLKEIHKTKSLILEPTKDQVELYANEFEPDGLLLFIDRVETPEEANQILSKTRNVYDQKRNTIR